MSIHCPNCSSSNPSSQNRNLIIRSGFFVRKSDQSKQQRFKCLACNKSFSQARFDFCYRQRKRSLNPKLFQLLVSGVSQRRAALLLKTNRKTIVRRFLFLGRMARYGLELTKPNEALVTEFEFDDLETFEHSKLKPLSVVMAVETSSRRILGFRVARMAAKGLLVKRALKKYGPRKDYRKKARRDLFKEIKSEVRTGATIKSDMNPHYEKDVREFFPDCEYETFKGRRGCVVGQGELKAGGFDPLFTLNHTFAMFRANVNRLFRRTWNTTKIPERLSVHIGLYVLYHNLYLIRR